MVDNAQQAIQFVQDARRQYAAVRSQRAMNSVIDQCMYMGIQWVSAAPGNWTNTTYSENFLTRLNNQTSIDSGRLRVTCNRITSQIQKIAASTFPASVECNVFPYDRDTGPNGTAIASVLEDVLPLAVEHSSLLDAARNANFQRCVVGEWGIGATITQSDGGSIECFDFDPYALTTDPAMANRPLRDHDWVLYSDVWSIDKLKRVYPEIAAKIDPNTLLKVGVLAADYVNLYRVSGRRMYSQYALMSETPGVRIHQLHCRYGRSFDKMYVLVELPGGKFNVAYDGASPFGGNGLPFTTLCGHRTAGGYGYLSDVSMMKDDQDALNLIKTLMFRMLQANAGWKWIVNRAALKPGSNEEDFTRKFTNTVGGAVVLENGPKDTPATAQLVQYPSPPPMIASLADRQEQAIMERGHRYEINQGRTQSHVPNSTYREALNQSDQVLSQRVAEDIVNLEPFLTMVLGTYVGLVQQQAPLPLMDMQRAGFDQQDAQIIESLNPVDLPVILKIRESSIRHRPHQERRSDLDAALMAQAISPDEYRKALADDLDTPITQTDGYYSRQANKAAKAIIDGGTWQPIPLGRYGTTFIDAFRSAMLSQQAKQNPAVMQELATAIAGQTEAMAAEQMLASGQTLMPPQPQEPQAAPPADTTLADIASVIEGQSPTVLG